MPVMDRTAHYLKADELLEKADEAIATWMETKNNSVKAELEFVISVNLRRAEIHSAQAKVDMAVVNQAMVKGLPVSRTLPSSGTVNGHKPTTTSKTKDVV